MSVPLLILAFIVIVAWAILLIRIRKLYSESLTSVEEKSAGLLHFYRKNIDIALRRERSYLPLLCASHYLLSHIVVLLVGLGFFFRTDANFLAVIIAVICSMQLFQRIYPGTLEATDE